MNEPSGDIAGAATPGSGTSDPGKVRESAAIELQPIDLGVYGVGSSATIKDFRGVVDLTVEEEVVEEIDPKDSSAPESVASPQSSEPTVSESKVNSDETVPAEKVSTQDKVDQEPTGTQPF